MREKRRKNDNSGLFGNRLYVQRGKTAATKVISRWKEKTQKKVKIPAAEVLRNVGTDAQKT